MAGKVMRHEYVIPRLLVLLTWGSTSEGLHGGDCSV